MQKILSVFYKYRMSLQLAFQTLDKDSSGKIDVLEFKNGLRALNALMEQPLSDLQISELHKVSLALDIFQLFQIIDKDGDGSIDYDEFLHSFQVVDGKDNPFVKELKPVRTSSDLVRQTASSPRKISTPDRQRSHSLPPLPPGSAHTQPSTSPPLRAPHSPVEKDKESRKNPFRRFFS